MRSLRRTLPVWLVPGRIARRTGTTHIRAWRHRVLLVIASALIALLMPGIAAAQFPVRESFQDAAAPGWILGGSAVLTAPGIDPVGTGWLRLTDEGINEAGFAYFDTPIPGTNGLSIAFEYATYGGTAFSGFTGDGLTFFLFDGTTPTFNVGAPGASLGYAQDLSRNGLSNGYVGIGLDEFGNYSSPNFGHSGGPGSTRASVAIRGAGNGRVGYPYLTGTGTLTPGIFTESRPAVSTSHNYRKVFIDIVPTVSGYSIALRLQRGTTITQIIAPYTVSSPPPSLKFGFAASTGAASNMHEIRLVQITEPVNHAITKTDGLTSLAIGSPITYTITAHNNGANGDPHAVIRDTVPDVITDVTWTCAASGAAACGAASGSGNVIDTTASLPAAATPGFVTYTISGTLTATTAPIVNTATVSPSAPFGDSDLTDNSATDTTLPMTADLAITKSDGSATYVPGAAAIYTIDVTNNGPFAVTNARVQDPLPPGTTAAWTCTGLTAGALCGAASGAGALDQLVSLPVDGTVRFHLTLATAAAATGTLTNTATVTPPATIADPTPGNNSATDVDTAAPRADLAVSKSSTPNPYTPGAALAYTVTVTNLGPSDITNATLQDTLPPPLSAFTWTCTVGAGGGCGTASGAGSIAGVALNLPRGGTARFVFTGTVPPDTMGQLVNTATVTSPADVPDPVPGNNTATDTNTSDIVADLTVTKSSAPNPYVPGAALTYTVVVTNRGPSAVLGALVQDALPAALSAFTWTCAASPGSACRTPSGAGSINALVDLPPNGTATFSITGTVPSGTTGQLANTATVQPPARTTDPVPGNNTATDTNPSNPQADLQIAKSSAPNPYVPGTALTYTIVVTNNGVSDVVGARVQDLPPPPLSAFTWTCSSSGGHCGTASGTGQIDALVDLPAGRSATFTLTGVIGSTVQGALVNTATVAAPSTVTDPTPGNNEASDNNGAAPQSDLAIVKRASPSPYVPGAPLTYTLTVSNVGPSAALGARVQDTLPAPLAAFTWTCAASSGGSCGSAGGAGAIDTLVSLPVNGTATFTVTGTVPSNTTGSLVNTATVSSPPSHTDPTPGNNTSTTTTPPAPQADLRIAKTAAPTPYVPGSTLTYTIVVSNAGPSDVVGATVSDPLPPSLASFTWTCSAAGGGSCATASGSGSINTLVNLPVNATATFIVSGTVSSSTTGALDNVATVAPPAGTTDPVLSNNTSGLSSVHSSQADLVISKSSAPNPYVPGDPLTYTIVATNVGPSDVTGARVRDTLPAALAAFTWTCAGTNGGVCAPSGAGNIDELVTLPNGASVTFTVTGTVPPATIGTLPNSSTITPPAGTLDPVPGNNTATDTNPSNPTADLVITKSSTPNPYVPGGVLTFAVQVTNIGPSNAVGARVQDVMPPALAAFTWTCRAAGASVCNTPSGAGSIDTTVDLVAGGVATFTITGIVPSGTTGVLANSATITPPPTVTDPVPGNNEATTTNPTGPRADLTLSKSSAPNPFVPGDPLTYTILVTNVGPSDVTNARVLDLLPAPFAAFTWTCVSAVGSCSITNGAGQVDTLVSLPAGTTATISITGIVPPETPSAAISNTATVTPPAGVTDPTPGNNQDTDVNTGSITADLSVTKSSTPDPYVPGMPLTYTIRVMNAGPSQVTHARVQDALPAPLSAFTWTCVASAGSSCAAPSGSGDLDSLVSLLVGGTATYTVTGIVPSSTTGFLINTVTVTPPADVTDPVPGNNTATDVNPTGATADLAITKTSTPKPYVPGGLLRYTIVVTNNGPSDVTSARVQDALPPTIAGFAWTCAASGGSCGRATGTGDIDALVSLVSGGSATFIVSGFTPPGPIVQLTNSATVAPPADVRDPVLGNNIATDNNPAGPEADLAITKIATPAPYVPGAALTYTIVATNNGPTGVTHARVLDTPPAALNGFAWSCTPRAGGGVCVTPNGVGPIDALVTLPAAGASVQFTMTGIVLASTTELLQNTVSIAPPPGVDDSAPGNNSASTATPGSAHTDLAVTKVSTPTPYVPGQNLTYTIAVSNLGPSDALGARVQDVFPPAIARFGWTCTAQGGAVCRVPQDVGSIDTLVDIPVGATVTFTIQGTLSPRVSGVLTNIVTVSPAAGSTDPTPGNNTATDTSTAAPIADLVITKTSTPRPFAPGAPLTYTITVQNNGPSDANGARLQDVLPPALAGFTWTCAGASGARCTTLSGAGAIDMLVDLPAGAGISLLLTGSPARDTVGTIVNTATIAPPAGTTDPTLANNTATDSNVAEPRADIEVTKTVDRGTPSVGEEVTFTVTVRNLGPSEATGVAVTDAPTSGLLTISATPSHGTFDQASGLWTIGALANGARATLQLRARVLADGTQSNVATKTAGDQIDPDTSNNADAATLTGSPVADVRITKTADASDVNVGSPVRFTITATNAGPSAATGVRVADPLPPGLAFVSATPSIGTFDPDAGTWTLGTLANGASETLTISAIVTQAGTVLNVARKVAQNERDPISANDADGAAVNGLSADIQVIKTASTQPGLSIGRDLTFFVTATNNGPSAATGVRIVDRLPDGLAFIAASASRGVYVPQTGIWEIGTLAASGAEATATLEVRARVTADTTFTNRASVATSDQPDPNPANNTSAVTLVTTPIDLADLITASSDPGLVGTTPTFFVDATNVGSATSLEPITIAVPLPAEYAYVPDTAPVGAGAASWNCTLVGRTVFCRTDATLEPGQQITASLRANVLSPVPWGRTLFAHLTTSPDFVPRNNVTQLYLGPPPVPDPDMGVDQTVVVSGTGATRTLTYRIHIDNHGPLMANHAVLTDVIPASATLVSANGPLGACDTNGAYVSCELGEILPGHAADATIVLAAPAPNVVIHTISVSSDQFDMYPRDNQSVLTQTLEPDGSADTDGDGIADVWESLMGLSVRAADGSADPDGDGVSNIDEYRRGTHPRGFYKQYFAEGVGSEFFQTVFGAMNLSTSQSAGLLFEFMRDGGAIVSEPHRLGPVERLSIDPYAALGSVNQTYSTVIESDQPIAADRTVAWGTPSYGAHAESGVAAPSTTWYFAEGATGPFELFYLLQNPNDTPAHVDVDFLLTTGAPITQTVTLAPFTRHTLHVNSLPSLAAQTMSARVTSDVPIVAERAMYFGHGWSAGTDGAGAPALATEWFFAEGATGGFFEEFILIANPHAGAADISAVFARPDGQTVTRQYSIAPQSRLTILVDAVDPPLASTAVAVTLTSTNAVPVVAERAMYWPDGAWQEGHVALGATMTGTAWAVPSGFVGGPQGAKTYVLIANASPFAGDTQVTLIFDNGERVSRLIPLGAQARQTVDVEATFPEAAGRTFGVLVESVGATPVPIVVESARYWSTPGAFWASGTSELGTRVR